MRTEKTTTALLLLLAISPLRAQTPKPTAADACVSLENQARKLTTEKIRCEAGPTGLILRDASVSAVKALSKKLFPEQKFLGFAILSENVQAYQTVSGPSAAVAKVQTAQLTALQARLSESPIVANFDNSVTRKNADSGVAAGVDAGAVSDTAKIRKTTIAGLAAADTTRKPTLVQGPPGSGGNPQQGNPQQGGPQQGGPPGSGGRPQQPQEPRQGPPGSGGQQNPPRTGPPGSGNPGQGTPPGASNPPSRPAPVWRSNFPAPAPNWWNTDFNGYDWWTGLPNGYDRPRFDQRDADTYLYYSGWYRWRDVFSTGWERTEDSATINRTAANQGQIHTRSLTSQSYRDAKECYYQAVYRYTWSQGGFNGSHWEERFDHYAASCIRLPRQYGQPRVYTSNVSFDMGLMNGQDLPWESDVIRITYDGQGQPRYDFSGAAYRYTSRLDDQRSNSESVTLIAGSKNLRAPESDKVQAFLRVNAGRAELVINDDRSQYYQGETLRVNVRIVRRVVIKVKGLLWGWNEKNVDSVIYSQPLDVPVVQSNPQAVVDLTGQASAAKPANAVRSSLFIESWDFSRVNSRISTGGAVRKGHGAEISF
jgi:hypothetical protein